MSLLKLAWSSKRMTKTIIQVIFKHISSRILSSWLFYLLHRTTHERIKQTYKSIPKRNITDTSLGLVSRDLIH